MATAPTIPVDTSAAMVQVPVTAADWLVIAPVVLPLMAGALLLMMRRNTALQWPISLAAALANLVLIALLLDMVAEDGPRTMTMGRWLPPFGIAFSADWTGALLALAGSVVALACVAYSAFDIDEKRNRYGFHPLLQLMMAGVNGAFLTGDIFNLYVWFEVLLISSFGLIVLGSERRQLDGAVRYAFLNLIATTLFLTATGLLYGAFGTLNMADIAIRAADMPDSAPVMTIAALYLFAFGMKAAAFPLNAWLPASYHTPRMVVAALFAGLLTKVGVYALLRTMLMLFPAAHGSLATIIAAAAIATMIVGALGALAQSDIRRLLGFLVVSGIGSMLAGLALGQGEALSGAIAYAVHSILVMAALYLAAGAASALSGSSDLNRAGGLYLASPLLAASFLVLALSLSGLPPFSGFWPKLMLVRGAIHAGEFVLAGALLFAGLLTTIAILRVWALAFWRPAPRIGDEAPAAPAVLPSPLPASALLPVAALAVVSLLLGLNPEPLLSLASAAADGLSNPAAYLESVFGAAR
jgi:multicomponent Na+:H+ antiporter subunit D